VSATHAEKSDEGSVVQGDAVRAVHAVRAELLRRTFNRFEAVLGIDFTIRSGECYGFLGPNGAGKTTTVSMIQGLLPISGGKLQVLGGNMESDPSSIKKEIGVVPQENNLDRDLTVLQNLITYARYFDIPKTVAEKRGIELLDFMQLGERRDARITTLSGGMQRRLTIARALINKPRLLILDEPTTGLDPQARQMIWQRLQSLKKEGLTIILTTHYMDEAERLCDRISIMDNGLLLIEGKPDELIEREVGKDVIEIAVKESEAEELRGLLEGMDATYERHGENFYVYPKNVSEVIPQLLGLKHEKILQRRASLEDLFLRLAGRSLRE
jgi:lipooligosaccharide transport system ATP-binding protein